CLDRRPYQDDLLHLTLAELRHRHTYRQVRLARAGRAYADHHIIFAQRGHVPSLAVGARPQILATLGHCGDARRRGGVAAGADALDDSAHILAGDAPLVAQHGTELYEDALRLFDRLLGAVDIYRVAAGHESHAKSIADQPQELVTAAEEEDRFL